MLDKETGTNLIQWPVEEIDSLRKSSKKFDKLEVGPGSVLQLEVDKATQVCFSFNFQYVCFNYKFLEKKLTSGIVATAGYYG